MRRPAAAARRSWAAARAALALAGTMALWLLRPALPHLSGSLLGPLNTTEVEQTVRCIAWLLAACLALTILTREVRALILRPTQAIPIPLPDAPRTAASASRALPRDAERDWSGQSPYVLTISTPIANTSSSPPPATQTPLAGAPSEENSPSVSISLLGPLVIGGLSKRIGRTATRELIAYLALHPHGAGRDELIEALWPGADPESTRPRLWQSVTEARKALGDSWLHDGERYQLDRGKIRIDLDELDRLLRDPPTPSANPSRSKEPPRCGAANHSTAATTRGPKARYAVCMPRSLTCSCASVTHASPTATRVARWRPPSKRSPSTICTSPAGASHSKPSIHSAYAAPSPNATKSWPTPLTRSLDSNPATRRA